MIPPGRADGRRGAARVRRRLAHGFDGVANVPGGGYIAVGSKQVKVTGRALETYGFAAKVSSTGSTVFLAVGYIYPATAPSNGADFFTARFGPTGTTLWTRTVSGGSTGDYYNAVKLASDGNYVIAGLINPTQSVRNLRLTKLPGQRGPGQKPLAHEGEVRRLGPD